jgi:hypothetical protein
VTPDNRTVSDLFVSAGDTTQERNEPIAILIKHPNPIVWAFGLRGKGNTDFHILLCAIGTNQVRVAILAAKREDREL